MTFLPIVERELRAAARRKSTYALRFFWALGTVLFWLILLWSLSSDSVKEQGHDLFLAFGILALLFCLAAGIFLTADCLSEEKREGTLGLLFLTRLRGYDVVLGKLAATSISAVLGLLAIFPILALPLLMGGVGAGEFWRMLLVLMITMLFSLGTGIFVSAITRETLQAMTISFMALFVIAGICPAIYWLIELSSGSGPQWALHWPSPFNSFTAALDNRFQAVNGRSEFWKPTSFILCMGCGLVALTALVLPRLWQDRGALVSGNASSPSRRWRVALAGGAPVLAPKGVALELVALGTLMLNPYQWRVTRSSLLPKAAKITLWSLLGIWLGLLVISLASSTREQAAILATFLTAYALHQVVKVLWAVTVSRSVYEDRRSGALELLLVTPLKQREILGGISEAARRKFLWPKRMLVIVNLSTLVAIIFGADHLSIDTDDVWLFAELFLCGIGVAFLDLASLQKLGPWMALCSNSLHRSILAMLGRVMLVPWATTIALGLLMINSSFDDYAWGLIFGSWFVFGIANDLFMMSRARAALAKGFRYWITEGRQSSGVRVQDSKLPVSSFWFRVSCFGRRV